MSRARNAAGARILTGAHVQRVIVERGRAGGARARMADGASIEVRSPIVVVAAGTIHTPLLLERSGIGSQSGQLGRNLSLHPATAIFARMEEIVDMSRGVPQSFYVDEFAAEGIIFEGAAGPPAYAAVSLPLTGRRHAEAMADYRRLALLGLMVSDSSRGSVRTLAGRPLIRYDLVHDDLMRFRKGLARIRELFAAAGARAIHLPLPEGVDPERARVRDLKLMAFHPLGTARADARGTHGVIDGDLAVHGVEGVYVADGSAVPSSLGVNPQLTIMALATRLAFRLLGRDVSSRHADGERPMPMSFLIDPPLLYSGGRAYARATRDADPSRTRDAAVGVAGMAIFWGVSVGLYLDQDWTRPVWRMCRAASGRDWMLNSGVFGFESRRPSARTHAIAGAIFATYPLWLWLGMRHDRQPVS